MSEVEASPAEISKNGFARSADGKACLGGLSISAILSEAGVETPAYVYDLGAIRERLTRLEEAFGDAPHLIAYAIKANSAGAIVREVQRLGAGVDAVSGGELQLALRLGVPARKIVLSGVAKRDDEIDLSLSHGIFSIQAESPGEVIRIIERARRAQRKARVSLRINPSVEIDSHSHISTGHSRAKFGILATEIQGVAQLLLENDHAQLVGLSTHVGSMLREPSGYLASASAVLDEAVKAQSAGHKLDFVDFGGGFGVDYGNAPAEEPAAFAQAAVRLLRERGQKDLTLVVEPGRSIVGPFGVLVSRVVQHKMSGPLSWVLIDAGMNDLLRPALYGARHRVEPLDRLPGSEVHQVAGPVCESTDNFGEHALGPVPDRVILRDAGAYAFSMASEYNGRPLPAEIFVDQGTIAHVVPSRGVLSWVEDRAR